MTPTGFPMRPLRRRMLNIGSAPTSTGAMFFPGSCSARKFRVALVAQARRLPVMTGLLRGDLAVEVRDLLGQIIRLLDHVLDLRIEVLAQSGELTANTMQRLDELRTIGDG